MTTVPQYIQDKDGDTTHYSLTNGVKVMACKYECGDVFVVSSRTRIPPHHVKCGIRASVECTKQMHNHEGPYWDKWRMAMGQWVARMRMFP